MRRLVIIRWHKIVMVGNVVAIILDITYLFQDKKLLPTMDSLLEDPRASSKFG